MRILVSNDDGVHADGMRILVDTSLLDQDEISIGSGQQGVAVILRQTDLIKAIGEPEVVDVLNSE